MRLIKPSSTMWTSDFKTKMDINGKLNDLEQFGTKHKVTVDKTSPGQGEVGHSLKHCHHQTDVSTLLHLVEEPLLSKHLESRKNYGHPSFASPISCI